MMLSRVAENTYWMARYLERAEDTARLVNVTANLFLDLPRKFQIGWEPLLDIMNQRERFYKHYDTATETNVIRFLVTDLENSSSIFSSITIARENTRVIRDILPRDTWEAVNRLYLNAKENISDATKRIKRYDYLRNIIFDIQCISGILAGTMTHDEAYQFVRIGRNLERADMTSRILDVQSASLLTDLPEDMTPFQNIQWVSVLKSMSAYQMYRKSLHVSVKRPEVIRFLMQEELFPRSVQHCIVTLQSCVSTLPRNKKILNLLNDNYQKVKTAAVAKMDQEELHLFIDALQRSFITLHNQINKIYF